MSTHPLLAAARQRSDQVVELIRELAAIESPTGDPRGIGRIFDRLAIEFEGRGFCVRRIAHGPGREDGGGHLLAYPVRRRKGRPLQLVVGHVDTVWPLGTLAEMPVRIDEGRLHGPGVFDMKGGVVQALFALDVLTAVDRTPAAETVFFLNSDEEIGSPDSKRHVRRLGRVVNRAFVPEPALGPEGRLKTARKGILRFTVRAEGRPAHAGLDPEKGRSAIVALAHATVEMHALMDLDAGVSVNVGTVAGGSRANVVAGSAAAEVDVRVPTNEAAARIASEIRSLESAVEGVRLEITGGQVCPPFERTDRNRRLWTRVQEIAADLGLALDEAAVGGGSDGNTLSPLTATLDGLGAVGDGAHASHEHLAIDRIAERVALLAALLASPLDTEAVR